MKSLQLWNSPWFGRTQIALVLLLPLSLSGPVAASTDSAEAWLARMATAFRDLNYDGVFTYLHAGELDHLRVVHARVDGVEKERVLQLDGVPMEIIRDGDRIICIHPGDMVVPLDTSIPADPFARAFAQDLQPLKQSYRLRLLGEDRIAQRPAIRIDIEPRDEHRFGYRLWLDAGTGLLLKSDLVNSAGAVLEAFQFASVVIGQPIAPEDLLPSTIGPRSERILVLDESAPAAPEAHNGNAAWELAWKPPGFSMTSWDVRRAPARSDPMRTHMYSDGLTAFSVFIEEMTEGAYSSQMAKGATMAFATTVRDHANVSYLVTVVGELPMPTAERIALSVRPADG